MILHEDVEEAKQAWVRECVDANSDLGLWFIAETIRRLMPGAEESEVRRETLAALRPLMLGGKLRAADALPNGQFQPWPGTVDEQLAQVEAEWAKLNRPPGLGEIVWFIGPR